MIEKLPIKDLASRMCIAENSAFLAVDKPLSCWNMQADDAPILRYLFRNIRPGRHLEFGTWQGFGTLCCLEECLATVWTINLLDGETRQDGSWAYSQTVPEGVEAPTFSKNITFHNVNNSGSDATYYQTDALGFIGRLYLEAGMGRRACQIYCDSRHWDTSNYPAGFFDSAFIDGGHQKDVVISDTRKALSLVRPGGLFLWHDYCKDQIVLENSPIARGVVAAVDSMLPLLRSEMAELFWIYKSQILLGIRK